MADLWLDHATVNAQLADREIAADPANAMHARMVDLEDALATLVEACLADGLRGVHCHGCLEESPCLACRAALVVERYRGLLAAETGSGMSCEVDDAF